MPKLGTKMSKLQRVVTRENTGVRTPADRTAAELKKKVGGDGRGVNVGAGARVAMMQKLGETDHMREEAGGRTVVPLEIEKEAIIRVASGAQLAQVARDMDLSASYVSFAMKRRFGSPEAAKKALQGLVLENALACMVHGGTLIGEMTGPQAIMSGAILTDKALALEKSMEGGTRTIDFGQLAEMGRTLKVLREIAAQPAPTPPVAAAVPEA